MKLSKCIVLLLALALIAVFAAGCTSSKPATATTTPAATPAAVAATATAQGTAVVAASTTPACPDKLVWDGKWDTRWKSEGKDISPDPNYPGYPWSGIDSPAATPVVMTQKCWDVTGTYVPADNPGGSGTIIAKIEGNQLKGTYDTVWPNSAADRQWGAFTITMAADNKSWVGYAKGHDRGDYQDPNNWVGRR